MDNENKHSIRKLRKEFMPLKYRIKSNLKKFYKYIILFFVEFEIYNIIIYSLAMFFILGLFTELTFLKYLASVGIYIWYKLFIEDIILSGGKR